MRQAPLRSALPRFSINGENITAGEPMNAGGEIIPHSLIAAGGFLPPAYLLDVDRSHWPEPSRRTRFRWWRRSAWYAIREWVAKLILPDGPWHESGWDD